MKNIFRLVACVVMLVMLFTATSAMAGDKAEISFCVGDDTLTINGQAVTVEKPYVVGEGVTLVPLRVITEAFGAKVEWIAETKSVEITYPDVEILLQIDNPVAEVNGKAEQLLAAPQLTNGGFTMVPLRFISETFGADVAYDETTRQITVVKDKSDEAASIVEGSVNSTYIGDSYYNWHMENPKDLYMDYREFDGTYTSFTYDDNNYFYIYISPVSEDYDFEKDFIQRKSSFASEGYTLVKADKDTSDSKAHSMYFQAKDKYEFVNIKRFITDEYDINVVGSFEIEKTELRDECIRIISTFKCSYSDDDTYDLSNVEDGFRTFESEELRLSFKVPQNYYMSSSEASHNEFMFTTLDMDDYTSALNVCVYSKSDVGSAEQLANTDYTHNKQMLNENFADFSDAVVAKEYQAVSAYEYEYKLNSSLGEQYSRDVFFELGEYVYNISVHIKLPLDGYNEFVDELVNSIDAKKLDADEVGILMRNIPEATGTYKSEIGNATFELPNNFYETVEDSTALYSDPVSGTSILVQLVPTVTNMNEARTALKEVESSQKAVKGISILTSVAETKIGSNKYYFFTSRNASDETSSAYLHQYAIVNDGVMYYIAVAYPEISYSEYCKQQVQDILASVVFEK